MCNACGFSCCAYDGFEGCGCDGCKNWRCWTKCDHCGEPIETCGCDTEDYWDEGDEPELAVNPVTGHVFIPEYEPEPGP